MSDQSIEETHGGWIFKRIGKNIYKIYRELSPHSITMTGADVTTQLPIPFPHRILRMHIYHTNGAYVESGKYLTVILRRQETTLTPEKFSEDLFNESQINAIKITEVFGEGFEYEAGLYTLILNTESTHLIFPIFYVQKLEG